MSKIEKIKNMAKVVLTCDIEFGHLRWSIAEIARRSEASRPLIYRYLGKSKLEILENSLRAVMDSLYRLEDFQQEKTNEQQMIKKLNQTLKANVDYIRNEPKLTAFGALHFAEESILGEILRSKEKHYINNHLKEKYDLKNKLQSQFFRIVIHGLVNGHFLSQEDQNLLVDFIATKDFMDWLRSIEQQEKG